MTDKKERTLVVIKPDGIQRSLVGEIIKRYERAGLKLVGLKMLVPDEDFIEKHYIDRKSTRLNSSHIPLSRMPSSA